MPSPPYTTSSTSSRNRASVPVSLLSARELGCPPALIRALSLTTGSASSFSSHPNTSSSLPRSSTRPSSSRPPPAPSTTSRTPRQTRHRRHRSRSGLVPPCTRRSCCRRQRGAGVLRLFLSSSSPSLFVSVCFVLRPFASAKQDTPLKSLPLPYDPNDIFTSPPLHLAFSLLGIPLLPSFPPHARKYKQKAEIKINSTRPSVSNSSSPFHLQFLALTTAGSGL